MSEKIIEQNSHFAYGQTIYYIRKLNIVKDNSKWTWCSHDLLKYRGEHTFGLNIIVFTETHAVNKYWAWQYSDYALS